jgi:hypothetical protein
MRIHGILFSICVNCARIGKKYAGPLDEFTWRASAYSIIPGGYEPHASSMSGALVPIFFERRRRRQLCNRILRGQEHFRMFLPAQSTST